MLVVGLTGNYGMGKSRILALFAKLGAYTFSSDAIVATLLTEKDVLEKIRRVIGHEVFYKNGSLNKKKVARLIFRDETLRRSLEDILHPLVFERIKDFLKAVDKSAASSSSSKCRCSSKGDTGKSSIRRSRSLRMKRPR